METVMNQIALYHRLCMICLIGMVLCIGAAVVIYKKQNIREVISFFWRNRKQRKRTLLILLCGIAGSLMSVPVSASQVEEGIIQEEEKGEEESEEIQDLAPVLERFLICPGSDESENDFIAEEGNVFYAKNLEDTEDILIKVAIRDEQEGFDESSIRLEYRTLGQELWAAVLTEDQAWNSPKDGMFETVYAFDGEENAECIYEFRISYIDTAGNPMIAGENVLVKESDNENGIFISAPKIAIDKICPAYEAVYLGESGEVLQSEEEGNALVPYYNAAKEVTLNFNIAETNLDHEKTNVKITLSDSKGNILKKEMPEIVEGKIQAVLKSDGHYLIEAYLVDKAGNEATYEEAFALDYEPPKQPVITYSTQNISPLERVINQLTFGYYAKEKITAHIQVEDISSGVKKVTYTYEDVDTKESVTETLEALEDEISVELPFSFKGNLKVYSEDFVGNESEEFQDIGVIAESEETHGIISKASVKVLTDYSKTPHYYAGDVKLKFSVKDSYSGIRSISYLVGESINETDDYREEMEIVNDEIVKEYWISASDLNINDVPIGLNFEDNAGHKTTLSNDMLPKIHIDTVSPKVRVVYDNYDSENEKYYRESRTATVYVTERNFDPRDVDFKISGSEADIGSWEHTPGEGCAGRNEANHTGHSDGCVWKCDIVFEEDGNYRFGFSCVDLAGNKGSYNQVDEFVIDKIDPVIRVMYDNYDVRNEIYYNAPRIAKITIVERNFQPEDVKISLTAETAGQIIMTPAISGWSSTEDNHQVVILYDYDGTFSFDVAYRDMAGNEAPDYAGDYFVVDLTKPEIVISEVGDKSANNGSISPFITITDTNYGIGSGWIEMIGWQNGIVDVAKTTASVQNGEMIRIQDIAHTKEMDDLYRLKVGAADLAGNISEVQITFSINRFGSVYTLDETTEKLAGANGTYYTDEEKRLVITETNVDTLLFQEIVCSLNGKLRTLKEGVDYTVKVSGDETSWKQYRYEIDKNNFTEEGHYILTIYSEDRAYNVSDNQSKEKSILFAVDKSAPSILISGVENEGRYRENSREFTVDVQDNIALAEVQILLNGKTQGIDMAKLQATDGQLTLTAESKNDWQTLTVYAIDRAGNEVYTKEITFLVTPNVFVQFYNHKLLFYGSVIVLSMLVAGTAMVILKRKKSDHSQKSS